ncbi:unnamed protein product, partial [Musa textilis]
QGVQLRSSNKSGRFGGYFRTRPVYWSVDNSDVELNYDPNDGILSFHLSDAYCRNSFGNVRI